MKKPYKLQGRYWALGINDLLSIILYRYTVPGTNKLYPVQYNDTVFQFFIARVLINCPYI